MYILQRLRAADQTRKTQTGRVRTCSRVPEERQEMSTHTPGPWCFRYDADGDHEIFSASERLVALTWGAPDVQRDEDEANARLIASAPDLLEALKFYAHDDGGWKARAAISKAEGR